MTAPSVKIKVAGKEKTKKQVDTYKKKVTHTIESALKESGRMLLAGVKSYPGSSYTEDWKNKIATFYPVKPPDNKYKRSGALQKSWHGRIEKKGASGMKFIIYQKNYSNPRSSKSAKEYSRYVMGDEQTFHHVGYWRTYHEWENEAFPYIQEQFSSMIEDITDKIFISVR